MSDDKSLELRSLVRRFTESTEALDGLNERMKSLSATAETLTRTNTGVSEMSGQMRRFVEEASRVAILLRGATEKVQSAVEKSVHLLDGGDLSEVKAEMRDIKALLEKQSKESQAELTKANSEVARLTAELAQVQLKIANLPPKVKKKHWD
jgi:multidrug resistance efflux pump